jgi:hypothetical protein
LSPSPPARRPFTSAELRALLDYVDDRVGWLAAFGDATLFKVTYAWGLFSRAQSACASVVL